MSVFEIKWLLKHMRPARMFSPRLGATEPSTRRYILAANEVRCACECRRFWSFANGMDGVAYDQQK